jgi:hypothetical protein
MPSYFRQLRKKCSHRLTAQIPVLFRAEVLLELFKYLVELLHISYQVFLSNFTLNIYQSLFLISQSYVVLRRLFSRLDLTYQLTGSFLIHYLF